MTATGKLAERRRFERGKWNQWKYKTYWIGLSGGISIH
ncbi:hypothetical protein BSI_16210 [Bacillus inaquosorum KCTC 13429]|uniref:Uncharacterized protein n=1 Tax=Bacillus inaquosorum KCTC 13429 TaxID=1236548 RepID=A0A9W5LKT2_9BACI|nr:hypothetical protein BSI_16210 [Bacillus inaquosorum KCTC 13429]